MKLTLNGKKNGNGNGNGRRNGNGGPRDWAKLALLAVALLLVGVLLYRQFDRLRGPKQEVWVASSDLAAGSVLSGDALERRARRASQLPENAVVADVDLSNQRLARPKREGEPITADDIQRRAAPAQEQAASLAELLPAGRVLASVRVDIQSVIMRELRFGDRFSILGSQPGAAAEVLAQDAFFVAWIDPALLAGGSGGNGGGRQAEGGGFLSNLLDLPPGAGGVTGTGGGGSTNMLLALHPQDVLPVSQAEASSGALSLVIHGKKEVLAGRLLSLRTSRVREVELIEGDEQEILQFRQ